jgi:hypothetical protein
MEDRDQLGLLWFKEKVYDDGTKRKYYSGVETTRDRNIFLFHTKDGAKYDYDLMMNSGEDVGLVKIGVIYTKSDMRLEGFLTKNKRKIVLWRSKAKIKKIKEIREDHNLGKISTQEMTDQLSNIKRWPDITIYYDNVDKKTQNVVEGMEKSTYEKEKRVVEKKAEKMENIEDLDNLDEDVDDMDLDSVDDELGY